jgi:mono/diheme cytochrome c family protein
MRWVPSSNVLRAPVAAALIAAAGLGLNACALTQNDSEVDVVAGKKLFVENCGSCHVLNRAGTKGTTGPNLDQAFQQSLKDGLGRSGIRGAVRSQINSPMIGSQMKADIVEGEAADQVAAYVAQVVARPGKDTGLLATAVQEAGGGEPAVARNGTLTIAADPNGQLLYVTNEARAEPGDLNVRSPNESNVPHNIVIDDKGTGEVVQDGGVSEFEASFEAGRYEYYCSVQGHRQAGMEGTLTVR